MRSGSLPSPRSTGNRFTPSIEAGTGRPSADSNVGARSTVRVSVLTVDGCVCPGSRRKNGMCVLWSPPKKLVPWPSVEPGS